MWASISVLLVLLGFAWQTALLSSLLGVVGAYVLAGPVWK